MTYIEYRAARAAIRAGYADAERVELAALDASYAAQQQARVADQRDRAAQRTAILSSNAAHIARHAAEQATIRKILDAAPPGGKSAPLHFFNVAIEEALADYPGWDLDPDDKRVTRPK